MSDEFDVNTLLQALENEENEQLMDLDYEKIFSQTSQIAIIIIITKHLICNFFLMNNVKMR